MSEFFFVLFLSLFLSRFSISRLELLSLEEKQKATNPPSLSYLSSFFTRVSS